MFTWNRRALSLLAVAALLFGAGCSSTEESPAAPSNDQAQAALSSSVLSSVDLLTCQSLPYATGTATIGPEGGWLRVGKSTLVVPAGALAARVTIKAEQIPGSVNSVRFSPEGLEFAKPANLTMGYDNCLIALPTKRIVYTTEALKVLEVLKSLDLRLSRTVTAPIDHFSRYAVAY